VEALRGQFSTAAALLEEALAKSQERSEHWYEGELHRLVGELLLKTDRQEEAAVEFGRALTVAQGQQARMWELRAATSLAQLWRDQGKHASAHDLLAPVYGWFTEGFDTPDLKEAKALLDTLVSDEPWPPSERLDGSVLVAAADDQCAAAQPQGVSSASRLLGQLLTSLVSTSVR
jgi:predicted ATPase